MTGIPDAEAAWLNWLDTMDGELRDTPKGAFLAGFAAAEGPWREHLATQIREHAEYVDRGSDELPRVRSFSSGLRTAARIVQDSTEDTPPQPLQLDEPLYDYVEKKPKRGKHR